MQQVMTGSGLLNIYKPREVSSYRIVEEVKRILQIKKVGHCGTLDPAAEGVLLILFGPATKKQEEFMGMPKTYLARLKLGITTDSGDTTGAVLETKPVPVLSEEGILDILKRFTGEIEQVPPMYSALKYGGIPLYKLARAGKTVERASRKVTVYDIGLLSFNPAGLELRIRCSRGTYIRTLGEDIGRSIGCGATVEYLCREEVGRFKAADALDGGALGRYGGQGLLERAEPL